MRGHHLVTALIAGVLAMACSDPDRPPSSSSSSSSTPVPEGSLTPALEASLGSPYGTAVGPDGALYIADSDAMLVYRVDPDTGLLSTFAGSGETTSSGDGGPALEAGIDGVNGISVDSDGHLYIAEFFAHRIRRVDGETGIITTFAGTGRRGPVRDGVAATETAVPSPFGTAVNGAGEVFIAADNRIMKVGTDGILEFVAGTGRERFNGNSRPALELNLRGPHGLAIDDEDNLYIPDAFHRILRLDSDTGRIERFVGTGEDGYTGDGGPASEAAMGFSRRPAVGSGYLYFDDANNYALRRVDLDTGIIETVAGNGSPGFRPGPGGDSEIGAPDGVSIGPDGDIYFADADNYVVWRLDLESGTLEVAAGHAFGT